MSEIICTACEHTITIPVNKCLYKNGQKWANAHYLYFIERDKRSKGPWLKQRLCCAAWLMRWEVLASLASTPSIFLSMLPLLGQDTLKKMGLKLCFMTNSQFPAFSLPPFSCLVTPAVWVSGPPVLSRRDAGPRRSSFLIRLLALRRAWGQSNCVLCVCACMWFGWRACLSAYVCYFALHALR